MFIDKLCMCLQLYNINPHKLYTHANYMTWCECLPSHLLVDVVDKGRVLCSLKEEEIDGGQTQPAGTPVEIED